MDAIQVVASATQIVSSMIGAVCALEQASRNLDEAPKRIHSLEEFVCELETLTRRVKQKHANKLHNSHLDRQIQSLNALVERLHPKLGKARRILPKGKVRSLAKVVWNSMAGDPLGKIVGSMRDDLNWWLESQRMAQDVEKVIESTARSVSSQFKIKTEQGFPVSSKCRYVRDLLERHDTHRVVLIVGLSGIGKSCLVRQVGSDPPERFVDGAVELGFGQWCSRSACNGSKAEYQKRLARKISKLLVQIGFWKKIKDELSGDLEQMCCSLQEALYGKSILIILDDVWEQDIVERFAKLYDNDCKYVVTTRNEAVYEITEAEMVELSKDDIREISKAVLMYHSLLTEEELPGVAESLLERCGHHPLTVAVMGKALRKEIRAEKWEKAITNLSTFATCAPGPLSYVNEKEAENTLTIFGSLEFSLDAMPEDSRNLFIAFGALSWAEPVPEACVEAIWSVIGHESMFPLIVCKLVEGSLLMKTESDPLYSVHDMVALYLDSKTNDSLEMLLNEAKPEDTANICPWLLTFGKESVKSVCEQRIIKFLGSEENLAIIVLKAITQALMASKSISELEDSRARFSSILGPSVANMITSGSKIQIAILAQAVTNIFGENDYWNYFQSLEASEAVDILASTLEDTDDPTIQTDISVVLAKLAEYGTPEIIDEVLQRIPFDQLGDLLSPDADEWHESVFTVLMSLTNAGKSKAVERMLAFEIDKILVKLLENGSEEGQHNAIVMLKTFHEVGGPQANGYLRPTNLTLLPWQVRLRLEAFVLSDRGVPFSPKNQSFEDLIHKIVDGNDKQVLQAMQDLIPIVEKARESSIRDTILRSPLIKRLAELLQCNNHSMKSQSAFLIMKLACSGGEACTKNFLHHDIIPELVNMMQNINTELQDAAYTTLHHILYSGGGVLLPNRVLQMGLVEKIVQALDRKSAKTREVNANCLLDLVEVGNRACVERMLALQVAEKLVKLEKSGEGRSLDFLVGFLKGIDRCKNLSVAERRIMKQQVIRKVRTAVRGQKFEHQILGDLDGYMNEGLKSGSSGSGSGSGSGKYRKL